MKVIVHYKDGRTEEVPYDVQECSVCDWQEEKILHAEVTDFSKCLNTEDIKYPFGEVEKFELIFK